MKRFAASLVIIALCGLPLKADSPQNFLNASLTTAVSVKNTGGTFYGFSFANGTAAACYIQFFNALPANVTLGTTVPVIAIGVASGLTPTTPYGPVTFSSAITVAATTAPTGGTPCAAGMTVNILFL